MPEMGGPNSVWLGMGGAELTLNATPGEVPEPASMLVVAGGLASLIGLKRRKQ